MAEAIQTTFLNQGVSAALSALVILGLVVVGRMLYKYLPDFLKHQNALKEEQIKATVAQSDLIKDYIRQVDSNNNLLKKSQGIHEGMSSDLAGIKKQVEDILTRILDIEKQSKNQISRQQFDDLIQEFKKLAIRLDEIAKMKQKGSENK
ncbi:hypothetical protein [Levyella massiliensis]|jgi:hypothetical protein|uniref:hypothetical protein n=1 Tax=Levyella massiliensis TaxID=938289 RepID=UPI003EBEFA71